MVNESYNWQLQQAVKETLMATANITITLIVTEKVTDTLTQK